jgi:hypothetical protein
LTKKQKIIISLGAIIGGWLLCGLAATSTIGQPLSTICVVLGLGFSVLGFISLILIVKTPTERNEK